MDAGRLRGSEQKIVEHQTRHGETAGRSLAAG
jgi:hypothetical protein